MDNVKLDFLRKYNKNVDVLDSTKDILFNLLVNNENVVPYHQAYMMLTNQTEATEIISPQDIKRIYKSIYDNWYQYLCLNPNKSPALIKYMQNLTADKSKKPSQMSPQDCIDFFNKKNNVANTQNESNILYGKSVIHDFVHVKIYESLNGQGGEIDCRLYINIEPKNMATFIEILNAKCLEKRQWLYYKFWTTNARSDNFVLYTNYNSIEKKIALIQEIARENPNLLAKSPNNPFLLKIDSVISFGEEPQYKHSSFNAERGHAIADLYNERYQLFCKNVANYNREVLYGNPSKSLALREWIMANIENDFKENLAKVNSDISNGIIPTEIKKKGVSAEQEYKYILQKMYNNYSDNLSVNLSAQIQKIAEEMLECLKNGSSKSLSKTHLSIPLTELGLTKDKDLQNHLGDLILNQDNGYNYYFKTRVKTNLEYIFQAKEFIVDRISNKEIANHFEKHHISLAYPWLNTETEVELRRGNAPTRN